MRYCLAAVQITVTATIMLLSSSCSTVGDLVVPWHDNSYANEGEVTTKVIIGQGATFTNKLTQSVADALGLTQNAAITNALAQYKMISKGEKPPAKKFIGPESAAIGLAIQAAYKLTEKVIIAERKKSTCSYSTITPELIYDSRVPPKCPLSIKILQFDKIDEKETKRILDLCQPKEIKAVWEKYSKKKKPAKETAKERFKLINGFLSSLSSEPNIVAQFVLLNKGNPTNGYAQIKLEHFKVLKTQAKSFGWGGNAKEWWTLSSNIWPPYLIVGTGQWIWSWFEDIHAVDMQVNLSMEFIYNGKVAEIGPIPFNVKVDLDESDDKGYLKCTPKESVSRYFPYPYTSEILAANITVNLIQTNEAHSELLTKAEEEYKNSKKDIEAFLKDLPDNISKLK